MDPLTLSLLFSAGSTAFRTGLAGAQTWRANRLANTTRPTYTIPKAITDNQRIASSAYNAASAYGLPGQSAVERRMGETQAGSIRAIRESQGSPSAILAGLSAVDKNARDANAALGVNAAQFREQNMRNTRQALLGANQVLAGYEDRSFNYNKDQPFQARMRASSALRNAAQNNAMMAIDQAATNVAGFAARGGFNSDGARIPMEGVTDGAFGQGPQGGVNLNMLNMNNGMMNYGNANMYQSAPGVFGQSDEYINQMMQFRQNNPWMTDSDFYNLIQQGNPGFAPTAIPNEQF